MSQSVTAPQQVDQNHLNWPLTQQRPQVWNSLSDTQRERLTGLGIQPASPEPEAADPAEAGTGGRPSFAAVRR
jgi:hypothetical protein